MHFTENEKFNQVTEDTLVIGVDIAKRIHYACMVDDRGKLLKKSFPVRQSHEGFESFYRQIRQAMNEHGKKAGSCWY
ncbi:IS110 family transposase [Domibacillus antri]|uniref:IS110 family transposase n=1 Tax=Domibacillus antri TaxID=1714264 RepID=A0A1Q8Q2F3_9BACI|nr:IS110 family transposase [Domibacillus antri]